MNTRIYYVSAPAGSGKTHRLEQYAATTASSGKRKILIAQPTKELIQQTANRISNLYPGVAVHTIYSNSSGDSVLPRIERHMAHAERSKGQVLLITHEALKRLPPGQAVICDCRDPAGNEQGRNHQAD